MPFHRMSRGLALAFCLAAVHAPAWASDDEPTAEQCKAAMDTTRALAEALPQGDLSRYFAERYLLQSAAEAGNGEFDDCIYWAQRGEEDVREHRHALKPGETLSVAWPKPLYPTPAPAAPAAKPAHAKRGVPAQPATPANAPGAPAKQG